MARSRRAAQSAPQEVLVPEAEQPYAVPENWRWVRGNGLLEPMESQIPTGPFFDYIDIDSIDNQNQRVLSFKRISIKNAPSRARRKLLTGDTLFSMVRPYLKNVAFVDASLAHCIASTGFYVCRPKTFIAPRFLYFLMTCNYVIEGLTLFMKGDNSPSIRKGHIENFPFPLPPRAEQERIVARIESLFARLDKAREKVDAVLGRCAARKAALLHKAFSGELTAGKAIKNILLEDIVLDIKIGPFGSMLHKDDYISNGVPIVNPKHIEGQKILVAINNTISKDKAEELAVYALKENDIVLGRRGEMGRCAPVSCAESGWICGTGSMIIRLKPEYNAKFYSLFISSCQGMRYLEEHAVGTTLKNLNEKIVRKLPVPSFSQQEQAEIVRILDELLARERRARDAAERVAARIEQIKRAVLTKAFRGELGTNDPAEPAALTEQGSLSLA